MSFVNLNNSSDGTRIERIDGSVLLAVVTTFYYNSPPMNLHSYNQIKEWVNKISKPYDKKIKYENKLKELETQVQNRIKEITENEDCEEVELGSICKFKTGVKFTMSNHYINIGDYGYIRINNLQENSNNMLYLDDDGYSKCKNCLVKEGDILLSDVSDKTFVKIVPTEWNNYVYYGSVIKCYDFKINKNYLYFYFLSDNFNNQRLSKEKGSIQKHLTLEILNNLTIKIPRNKKLISNMDVLFEEIEITQQKIKDNEKLYKQYIKELSDEAIPKTNNIKIEDTIITQEKNKTKKIKKSKNIINKDIDL